eukprot:gene9476-biopygen10732
MADPCTTPRGPSSGGEGGSCVLPAQLRGEDGVQRAGAGRRRSRHCGAVILPSQSEESAGSGLYMKHIPSRE